MKNIKKILAVLCAATMLVGMMGTVVLAEDTWNAVTIKMTKENAASGVIKSSAGVLDEATGNFMASATSTKKIWTLGTVSGATTGAYTTAPSASQDRWLNIYPGEAGLTEGFYNVYQHAYVKNANAYPASVRYRFQGRLNSDDAVDIVATTDVARISGTSTGGTYQYVGTYSFAGSQSSEGYEEFIQIGTPKLYSQGTIYASTLVFEPVTAKTVEKTYTTSVEETLVIPVPLGAMGDRTGIDYEETVCATKGTAEISNNVLTYEPNETGVDTFTITATRRQNETVKSVITLNVTVNIVDDNAIYLDDTEGHENENGDFVRDVTYAGYGGASKTLSLSTDGYKWDLGADKVSEGVYEVFFHKTGETNLTDSQTVTISHNGRTDSVGIYDLNDGNEGWVSLGVYDFAGESEEYILTKKKDDDNYNRGMADAVKLVPVKQTEQKYINIYTGQTYKEGALLTYGGNSALEPVLTETVEGVLLSGNEVIYTGDAVGTVEFSVACGDYTVNYTATVKDAPAEPIKVTQTSSSNLNTAIVWSGWKAASAAGIDSNSAYTTTQGATAKWTPAGLTTPGYYQAQIYRVGSQSKQPDYFGVEVYHNGMKESFIQRGYAGTTARVTGGWFSLGDYYFCGDGTEYVKITNLSGGYSTASSNEYFRIDGFQLLPVTQTNIATDKIGTVNHTDVVSTAAVTAAEEQVKAETTLTNASATGENLLLVNALYNNGELEKVYTENVYLAPYSEKNVSAVSIVPAAAEGDDYQIKTFIWEAGTLKPIMQTPAVLD